MFSTPDVDFLAFDGTPDVMDGAHDGLLVHLECNVSTHWYHLGIGGKRTFACLRSVLADSVTRITLVFPATFLATAITSEVDFDYVGNAVQLYLVSILYLVWGFEVLLQLFERNPCLLVDRCKRVALCNN